MDTHDLIIIGGGPTGLNCAIAAEKAGLDYLVLEKGVLANSIYHFPVNMTFFSTSKLLEIGDTPFISHGEKPTRREALEYYRRLQQSYALKVRTYEAVQRMERTPNGRYHIHTEKGRYETHSVIVATGFYDTPRLMNVPGEGLAKVKHYYDDAHPYVGQKVLVIGAANSACQVALEIWRKGAEVTMAIRDEKIYKGVKYWIKPDIENRIKEGSIKTYFHSSVREIRPREVILETPEGAITIENDWVLAMTGYLPIERGNAALIAAMDDRQSKAWMAITDAVASFKQRSVEATLKAMNGLDDNAWQVRVTACQALAAVGTQECMDKLIERFELEKGRLEREMRLALKSVANDDLGADPATWKKWWDQQKERFGGFNPNEPPKVTNPEDDRYGTQEPPGEDEPHYYGRQIYSLSRAGYFPRFLSLTHPTRQTPHVALVVGAGLGFAVACLIRALGTGSPVGAVLLNMAVFGAVLSYVLQMLSYVLLRKRHPQLARPYKSPLGMPGAVVALLVSLVTLVALFVSDPVYRKVVLGAAVWYGAGLLYFAFFARHRLVLAPEELAARERG